MQESKVSVGPNGAGSAVCLTFDDWFVRGWYGARPLFDKYNARATFFVGKPDKIAPQDWDKLRVLQAEGHEIGCHTMTHARLIKFLKDHTFDDYIDMEILPALKVLREEGVEVTSFAYPYFKYRPQLTGRLLEHFRMVREAGVQASPVHAIYPTHGNANVNVMGGLDRTGLDIPMSYYDSRFRLLAEHGGTGYFCGHALGPDVPKNRAMTCSYEDLEEILALARAYGLDMPTMRSTGFRHWGPVAWAA